jgi:hypothetical protein
MILSWTVCASVGIASNMNKLSLVGMQLAKKSKEIREITWAFIYYECKSDYVTKN